MPDTAMLPKIAEIFDASIDDLFGIVKKPLVEYVPEKQRDFEKTVLRVLVDSHDGDHIKVNLPMTLIKVAMEVGASSNMISIGNADLSKIDFEAIIKMVESGAVGRIAEIESGDGDTVVVEVV